MSLLGQRLGAPSPVHEHEPSDEELRVRLEGGYELLEAAIARYRALAQKLHPFRSSLRFPIASVELAAVRVLEPEVKDVLARLAQLTGHPATALTARVELARRELIHVLQSPRSRSPSLSELLTQAEERCCTEPPRSLFVPPASLLQTSLVASSSLGGPALLVWANLTEWSAPRWVLLVSLNLGLLAWLAAELRLGGRPPRRVWVAMRPESHEVTLWTGREAPQRLRRLVQLEPTARLVFDVAGRGLVLEQRDKLTGERRRLLRFPRSELVAVWELAQELAAALHLELEDLARPKLLGLEPGEVPHL